MAFILYCFADGTRQEIEVAEEFAKKYAEMEHKDALIERKETRRHQSLDKSLSRYASKHFGGNREEGIVRRNTESVT